ncbi:hypothetical protein C6503_01440 [Candidatus Poribacteria bacterium]|nr:MAG: hypothetical protein C6503_01440 [Candidatus Poribacteria bacterium]
MLKKMQPIFLLLLIFGLSTMSVGNEWANYYFPDTVGSYWTYEDQDGNELTRYAIEPEDIDGETYRAFSYDPALEDWADFEHYIHPYFYQVGDDWVAYFVGAEIENGLKAHTAQEMEEALPILREQMLGGAPEGAAVSLDLSYDVEVESADYFYLLPTPITYNEEWTALELNVALTITMDIQGAPVDLPGGAPTIKTHSTIIETGVVTGTETVETPAGTFEDCLIIEYQTDETTQVTISMPGAPQQDPEEREATTITTLWLAPNVGIVKFSHEHPEADEAKEQLGLEPDGEITLELTNYEIKGSPSEDE